MAQGTVQRPQMNVCALLLPMRLMAIPGDGYSAANFSKQKFDVYLQVQCCLVLELRVPSRDTWQNTDRPRSSHFATKQPLHHPTHCHCRYRGDVPPEQC